MPQYDTKPVTGLDGVRVLDLSDPKGALCGKLMADLGADVVRVEPPPDGDPMRGLPPLSCDGGKTESLFFWYFNTNKRSAILDLGSPGDRQRFLKLVASADVLLECFPPGHLASLGLGEEVLFQANPGLILASVTSFGQTGPHRDFYASDIVAWAMGGVMSLTGDPAREPLTAGANQAYQVASIWSTIAILAALIRRGATGQGARLDISAQEAVVDMSEAAHSYYQYEQTNIIRNKSDHPLACPFRNVKTKDSYAFVGAATQQMWSTLVEWMAETVSVETVKDSSLDSLPERINQRDRVNEVVVEWARHLTSQEVFIGGAERGIPNAPIRRMSEVVSDDQLASRNYFIPVPDPREERQGQSHLYPGIPFRGRQGPRRRESTPAPELGAHTAEVFQDWAQPRSHRDFTSTQEKRLPLEGLRVVDLCWMMAGPTMGRILADLGATVIKVEAREIGDPWRMAPPFVGGEPHVNRGATFHEINRNKMSLTLNLKQPRAKELLLDLARWADVCLENFTSGTLDRLGIGYDVLSEANPRLILASLCGYGQTGPRQHWPSFHPTSAALSGLIHLFAYPDSEPMGFGNAYMDYLVGFMGAIGLLEALLRRDNTGEGDHVDVSQLESGVVLVGPEVLQWVVNGEEAEPMGNWSGALGALLQGCYRCQGDENWIVVTAPDQAALDSLAQSVGLDSINGQPSADQVEAALARWAQDQEPWEAMRHLQFSGVPAGVVAYGSDMLERDKHLKARQMFVTVDHPDMGPAPVRRSPFLLDGQPLPVRRPSPLVGEHTEWVLREVIGLSEEEYLECVVQEVV